VAISDDGKPVMNAELMRRALEYSTLFRIPVIQHAEDVHLTGKGVMHEGRVSTELGFKGIPAASESVIVARDLLLAELTGGHYHVAHVSTAEAVQLVREAKRKGHSVTCEVAPHHFALSDEAVKTFDTNTKMSPPLRSTRHVEAVKAGLADGTIDAIATDHAPHSLVEKDVEFDAAMNGIVGLETAFPVCLALVKAGRLTERRLVEALTAGPARAFGLPGGTLAAGSPADVAILDPGAAWRCEPATLHSKSKNSPWKGRTLTGRCTHAFVGGRLVHQAG